MLQSTTQIIERDWLKISDSGTSPSFAFPTLAWPHLYMVTSFKGNLETDGLYLDRLEFADRNGQRIVIYQCPITGETLDVDNPEAIAYLSPNFQCEAHWAYSLRAV